jgi:CheY-like chemotaxis protein
MDGKPYVLVNDIKMPQKIGTELTSIIQNDENREKIPIIYISAYNKNKRKLSFSLGNLENLKLL